MRLVLLIVLAASGCAPQSRVLVTFGFTDDAGAILTQATRFEWAVLDRAGRPVAEAETMELGGAAPDIENGFVALTLEPYDGDASATYELIGTLYDATGTRLSAQRARGGYTEGEALELRLLFDDPCGDPTTVCDYDGSAAETCQDGACYEPCVVPTPMNALGNRRSPAVTCPESPTCVAGEPLRCVPHGGELGIRDCIEGVYAIVEHCATMCDVSTSTRVCD